MDIQPPPPPSRPTPRAPRVPTLATPTSAGGLGPTGPDWSQPFPSRPEPSLLRQLVTFAEWLLGWLLHEGPLPVFGMLVVVLLLVAASFADVLSAWVWVFSGIAGGLLRWAPRWPPLLRHVLGYVCAGATTLTLLRGIYLQTATPSTMRVAVTAFIGIAIGVGQLFVVLLPFLIGKLQSRGFDVLPSRARGTCQQE